MSNLDLFANPFTYITAGLGVFFVAMALFRAIHRHDVSRSKTEVPPKKPFSIADPFSSGVSAVGATTAAAPVEQTKSAAHSEALFRKLTSSGTMENSDTSHQDSSYIWE